MSIGHLLDLCFSQKNQSTAQGGPVHPLLELLLFAKKFCIYRERGVSMAIARTLVWNQWQTMVTPDINVSCFFFFH